MAKGQLTRSTRNTPEGTYVTEVLAYTPDYQPRAERYTIPGPASQLGGTYTYGYSYNVDGSLFATVLPAIGGLPAETLKQQDNATGQASSLLTSLSADGSATMTPPGGWPGSRRPGRAAPGHTP